LQIKTKIVSCHTADSKSVKEEVNITVIHPPLVFPDYTKRFWQYSIIDPVLQNVLGIIHAIIGIASVNLCKIYTKIGVNYAKKVL
jgi:hypothetical protein